MQEEAQTDLDNLNRYILLLKNVSGKLLKNPTTATVPSTPVAAGVPSGPEDRNKVPQDQYDELKRSRSDVLTKIHAWLGFNDENKT